MVSAHFLGSIWLDGLFQITLHAIGYDVQEGQHAHGRMIDDFFFFLKESIRSVAAGINNRRDTDLQSDISRESERRQMRASIRRKPIQRRTPSGRRESE